MKTNLKENIWINGFDHDFRPHQFWFSKKHEIKEVIYLGKTSEIPEEIAKECVDKIQPDYELLFCKDYSIDANINVFYSLAKDSIQSACNQEYCIIYKL